MIGTFAPETVDAYDKEAGSAFTSDCVEYLRSKPPEEFEPSVSASPSFLNTLAPPQPVRIIYLDDGRWGGNGGAKPNWPKARDFGVVCGRSAALASYDGELNPGESARGPITADEAKNPEVQVIREVLDKLSSKGKNVKLRKVLTAPPHPFLRPPPADTVFVFLGDAHLPVLTSKGRALEQSGRFGRLTGDPITLIPGFYDIPGKMPVNDAIDWFDNYEGDSTSYGADIFQSGGADLSDFIDRLREYQTSSANTKLKLIQTGDMFDFWVGLACFFAASENGFRIDSKVEAMASQFVNHWIDETLLTSQGEATKKLIGTIGDLGTVFLYGNHDNYLCRYPSPPRQGIAPRPSNLQHIGLYTEHGHQSDESNKDGATMGHTVTQAAFFQPKAARDAEPFARKLLGFPAKLTKSKSGFAQRLIHMGAAMDLCLTKHCAIYVMGHTHQAMLKLIELRKLIVY